jgi:transcriptional regulator with XRE-family HTH domain
MGRLVESPMSNESEQYILIRFGQQVRSLRQNKAMSQEELASRAGVHRTYIGMIERGEKNVTIITMIKLATALEVTITELLKDFDHGK